MKKSNSKANSENYRRNSTKGTKTDKLFEKYIGDVAKVIEFGGKKYGSDGWLEEDAKGMSRKEQKGSITRHLKSACAWDLEDHESKLHPALHIICRAYMMYIRDQEQIFHTKDVLNELLKGL